jgi:hypothetical protein
VQRVLSDTVETLTQRTRRRLEQARILAALLVEDSKRDKHG